MEEVGTVSLPGSVQAIASDGASVWCAAAGRLLAFDAAGSALLDVLAPSGLRSLAAAQETLAATVEPGIVAWLDRRDGSVLVRLPFGGDLTLLAGGGAVWVLDRRSLRAWRLDSEGAFAAPVALPGLDRVAPDGELLWWTSREDTLLRGGGYQIDLGVSSGERGAIASCAGSIWTSVRNGLIRVGTWGGEAGPLLAAPEGPVEHMTCGDGILVGGSGRCGLFVLDPSLDDEVRHLDADLGGKLSHLVATRSIAWAIPTGRAEARLIRLRP